MESLSFKTETNDLVISELKRHLRSTVIISQTGAMRTFKDMILILVNFYTSSTMWGREGELKEKFIAHNTSITNLGQVW